MQGGRNRMKKVPVSLYELSKYFEAHVERSPRKFNVMKRQSIDWYRDPIDSTASDINGHRLQVEEVEAVAIHIPDHRVDDFLDCIDDSRIKEMEIRNSVPAVKKAYEQYRLLLKMCGYEDARY